MNLIINEKPSVAQEFAKVLGANERHDGYITGNGFIITWCVGHLVRLSYPEKYDMHLKKWNMQNLPFIPEEYIYEVIPEVAEQFNVVKKLLNDKSVSTIYYAGDSAREGIYIQFLVRQMAKHNKNADEKVVWINSQTKEEIIHGVNNAKSVAEYEKLAASGYMRAIEDYLVGINFSRALTLKFGNIINSASGNEKGVIAVGRVMICVLAMIVDREREIRNFKEKTYYRLKGTFNFTGKSFEADWKVQEKSDFYNSSELYSETGFNQMQTVQRLAESIMKNKMAIITEVENKTENKNAPLLFNLAELQNECTKKFKIGPDETLAVIQELYEKKLITYPRTDARVLSSGVAGEIVRNISGLMEIDEFSFPADKIISEKRYLSIGKRYVDDSKISDHYAIIPTGITENYNDISGLKKEIYFLIIKRFLSVFYPPAQYERLSLKIMVQHEMFTVTKRVLKNKGYLDIAGINENEQESELSLLCNLRPGSVIMIDECKVNEGKTSPPSRFTTGSIILAMENAGKLIEDDELREKIKSTGIGTSATRGEIIKKLQSIGYIAVNQKNQVMTPEKTGEMIYETIKLTVPDMLVPEYTASWEKGLEQIADGEKTREQYNNELNGYIRKTVEKIKNDDIKETLIEKIRPYATGVITDASYELKKAGICPECGKDLVIRKGKYGNFISCSGYPECNYIKKSEKKPLIKAGICPECGKDLVIRKGKFRSFVSCSGYPVCNYRPKK